MNNAIQRMDTMKRVIHLVLILAAVALTGCTYPYVNIPPAGGDLATHDPNSTAVREVTAASMKALIGQTTLAGNFEVVLPEGSTDLTYHYTLGAISDRAVMPGELEATDVVASYTIKGIRIRGAEGEVDIQTPSTVTTPELVTAYLEWSPGSGWHVERLRIWRGQVVPPQ